MFVGTSGRACMHACLSVQCSPFLLLVLQVTLNSGRAQPCRSQLQEICAAK